MRNVRLFFAAKSLLASLDICISVNNTTETKNAAVRQRIGLKFDNYMNLLLRGEMLIGGEILW